MATATVFVPLEEYLDTTYRPDRDWVDGELKERNVGEKPHAKIQTFLSFVFRGHQSAWGVEAFSEQRVQTSEKNYRIADLCVTWLGEDDDPIVRTPPLLCVEILSRDDRMSEMQERVEDYLRMGVRTVWIIDPRRRKAFSTDTSGAMQPVVGALTVPGTMVEISLADIFDELD